MKIATKAIFFYILISNVILISLSSKTSVNKSRGAKEELNKNQDQTKVCCIFLKFAGDKSTYNVSAKFLGKLICAEYQQRYFSIKPEKDCHDKENGILHTIEQQEKFYKKIIDSKKPDWRYMTQSQISQKNKKNKRRLKK